MKRFMVVLFLALFPASALAQSEAPRGWGYGFGAIGATSGDFGSTRAHFGGGGEARLYKGLGVGAELGYVTSTQGFGSGFGLASTNVSYHFYKPGRKLVPFVTGGGSIALGSGASGGGNFGGGVQYWMSDRVGLRFEFRDHVFSSDAPHLYGFRVGFSFK